MSIPGKNRRHTIHLINIAWFSFNMASVRCLQKIKTSFDCFNECRYVGALTGIINIALFLPGFFKEFDVNKAELKSKQKVCSPPLNQEVVTDGLQKKRRELLRQNTTFSIVSVDGKTMAASPSKHVQPSTSFWGSKLQIENTYFYFISLQLPCDCWITITSSVHIKSVCRLLICNIYSIFLFNRNNQFLWGAKSVGEILNTYQIPSLKSVCRYSHLY